jgi:sensor domain CHASE-containing protein
MEWAQLISTLGFPIVCCVALAIYVTKITQQNREDTKELNKQHTAEMLEFKEDIKEALNNNTIALNKLCEKLEKVGDNK